jgi:hypothetical protein
MSRGRKDKLMDTLQVGDIVRVLYPFNTAFPGAYPIKAIHENGVCMICEDRDFDPVYLEKA